MGDYVVLDSIVDLAGHDAAIEQVILGVVGSEAHDAPGPTARHSWHFQQFFLSSVIDVDARVGCWNRVRFGRSWRTAGHRVSHAWQESAENGRSHRSDSHLVPHEYIVALARKKPQAH